MTAVRPISVSARRGAPEETAADTRVVGLFEGEELSDPALQQLVELGEAKPALKRVAVTHEDAPGGGKRRVLIAGLGKRDELDAEKVAHRGRQRGRARQGAGRGVALLGGPRRAGRGRRRGHAAAPVRVRPLQVEVRRRGRGRRRRHRVVRGGRRRGRRGRRRARRRRRRVRQPRPRPAEHAGERRHPLLPRRARHRDRQRARRARDRAPGPRRDPRRAGWAPSRPWRRAPTSSRA